MMVQGLKEAKKEAIVVPAIEQIVTLIHKATSDTHCAPGVLKAAIGLLGGYCLIFCSFCLRIMILSVDIT